MAVSRYDRRRIGRETVIAPPVNLVKLTTTTIIIIIPSITTNCVTVAAAVTVSGTHRDPPASSAGN